MYNNPYMQNFNQQSLNEKIDSEIAKLQQMKNHNITQPAINQTFQLAPTNNGIKFVTGVEDVQKELTIYETPFITRDYSTLWIKNAKGEIRTFKLEEVIPRDEKDIMIENLQMQINSLSNQIKEMSKHEQQYDKSSDESRYEYESQQPIDSTTNNESSDVSSDRTSKTKSK